MEKDRPRPIFTKENYEEYLISTKMIKCLNPDSEIYQWHQTRLDYLNNLIDQLPDFHTKTSS